MRFRTAALLVFVAALAASANAAPPHSAGALSGAFLMGAYPGAPEGKAAQDKTKAAMPSSQATDSGQYVGATVCQGCHDELYKGFERSPHWMTTQETNVTHGAHGCESCHGPGAAHVEGGGDKSKIFTFKEAKSEEVTKRCLSCHEAKPEQRQFMQSTHNQNGVSCTSCHSIHHTKAEYLLISKQPGLCYSCHAEQKADFQKPFRHRVDEGLIKCTDCHNAHGTLRDRQVRSAPNQDLICVKCHSDKRGPFVFEHEPVRVEGCPTCHTPHASAYPRLLLTARVNALCLQCHEQIPTGVHGPQNTYRSTCIICHNSIHGSNVSNFFFK
ncbi:MAG: DmsE family decaheme c-type cytochrome [Terriglobales bacterium]